MAVDTNFASSLLQNLKLEDPLLPPTTWESIPSESGHFHLPTSTSHSLYHASTVSEASLVRLAMNALQGVESSLISVQKLSAAFRSDPADRTFHQVPSLWSRSSSTHALGNVLHPIGCSGLLVFLLGKFVDYFTDLNVDGQNEAPPKQCAPYSLVNHAFAVAVGKVVEGYMCALDTLYASVGVRRRSSSGSPSAVGCLNSVVHSELTLLELYLHTKELRTQIESLTNTCNLYQFSDCFSASSFDELLTKAKAEFCNFYRGGDLLTYLYTQLQVADPAHRPVLKFLFLRTCEPYFGFIRSWIFKAEISDPYEEFLVEYVHSPNPSVEAGISIDFPLATIRERDGVPVPCFLKDFLLPLFRAGQQLQVLAKLLELCTFVAPKNRTYESFLPCWSGFSSNCPSYASPLTFSKGNIEAMVLSRECYYKRMQDQLQNLLMELEFRFQQVISQDTLPVLLDNSGRSSTIPVLVPLDDSFIAPSTDDERESNVVADDLDSDELCTRDNVCYTADAYESSECSSSTISEEQNVFEQMTEFPNHIVGEEQKYLSALSFSMSIPVDTLQKPHGSADSCHIDKISRSCERKDAFGHSHHKGILTSQILDVQFSDCLSDKDWPERDYFENQSVIDIEYKEGLKSCPTDFASKVNERIMGSLKEGSSYFRKRIMDSNALMEEAFGKAEPQKASYTSDTFALQQWKVNYHNNFLSMNPMLTKNNFLHLTSRPGERCKTDLGDSLAYFDFSHIKDPCKVFPVKVPVGLMDSGASTTSVRSDHHLKQCSAEADVLIGRTIVSDSLPSSDSKGHTKGDATLKNVSGGSCWESLLGRFSDTVINRVEDHRESLAATFDIPLDFIIDTCLLQEIMLQYKYVSKLTIKLLEEGFDLQEHLLALRRYHFMELADWADLFIMSLWHHKWSITQADHRLSEIQSFLESSVQRSSCERDHNKDRLFVYLKGHDAVPLSASAIGVHSFNFLGLGYRVDWPISIVLTPAALKIYAEIFSFLIQVKLALFSLTDVWCQLKDLVQLISRNNHSAEVSSSSVHRDRIIIVANQLPIRAQRKEDSSKGWIFSWDENSLLLQLKDGLGDDEIEVIYVGCLKEEIHPNEQDEVSQILLETFKCVPTFLPPELFSRYYHGFCKQQLWPLFHYMLPLSPDLGGRFNRSLWQAYVSVNKIFADRIMEVINPEDDFVWIHDYHLMVLPTFLRKRFNRVKLGFFLHSPFPSSEIYKTLPIREEILRALLNSDLIGFHTFDYARHFLSCCSRMLGLTYESKRGYIGLEYYGRTVSIKILPVGIHMGQLQSVLSLPETEAKVAELKTQFCARGRTMLLGVDDMDIFKGISLKLLAMEQLLIQHPEWQGKVVLVQIANPARGRGKDVKEVQAETSSTVKRINETFGKPGYNPVVLIDEPLKFYERIAYYVVAECCLVTAVRDGMNLIPYEYIISRQGNEKLDKVLGLDSSVPKKSMLVVSEFIGCSPSLSGAIRVNPWNIDAVADAMDCSLEMAEPEKQLRHEKHYKYVSTHDVGYWARSFLQDLERTCKGHLRQRCWGIGFGLSFRVVALDPNFKKLSVEYIVSAYKRTTTRAILLDYDGTLKPQASIDKSPNSKSIEILNSLCRDKNNMVLIVSAKSRKTLAEWFSPCEKLGIAAEHGYFLRSKQDTEWETLVPVADSSWKQIAEPVMKLYTETTDGSTIEDKETSLLWCYEDADPDFGSCQAKELMDHLESVLANEPVTVKSGQTFVEVKPQGVSKGLVAKRLLSTMQERGMLPDFVLCIGDDRSDEDMFEVITSSMEGPSIAPRAEVFACTVCRKPSKAKYYLDDTAEIVRMLQGLASVSEQSILL